MRARRRLVVGLVAISVAAVSAACSGPPPAPAESAPAVAVDAALRDSLPVDVRGGELVVGTDPSYAPMSSFADDGRSIVGMEPDLASDLGTVLGVRVTMREVPFDELLDAVEDGRIDLAMSAMTDTPERAERVDFVNYFEAGTAIVVQRGNPRRIAGLDDLCGTTVALERGTVQVDLVARQQDSCGARPVTVEELPTNADALLRLRTGRAAAVLTDLPPAALLATERRSKVFFQLASREQYEPGLYGIVVAKGRVQVRDAVAGALEQLVEDGHYAGLLGRWGLENGAVTEVTVNSGR